MAGKSKDQRPARAKQKARSINNKVKQLKNHLEKFPKDTNAQDKLEKVQKSGSTRRIRPGAHPTQKIIARYSDGRVKREQKDKRK